MDHIGQAGIHTTGVDAATGTQRSAHVPVMQVNPCQGPQPLLW